MSTIPMIRSAGGRRFWWTVAAFALVNAVAWVSFFVTHRPAPNVAPTLKIERFSPGDTQNVGARQTLVWTFNTDVGPALLAGSSATAPSSPLIDPPGMLVPNVPGKWAWSDARTLTFSPDADFPRATRFTLTLLPQKLRSTAGGALAEPYIATVQTRPLDLLGVRHVGLVDRQPILELSFNDTVNPLDVLSHAKVFALGEPVPFQLHGEGMGKLIRLRCSPNRPSDRDDPINLTVSLSPGLAGTSGPLGLQETASASVHISSNLIATEAQAHCPPSGDPDITVYFNSTVDPEKIRQVLTLEPAIPFTIAQQNNNALRVAGAFLPGTRYSIRIAKSPPSGTSEWPRAGTFSVYIPDRPTAVWFEHDEGYLGSSGNRTLMAHAVNVPAVHVTIYRVYDNNLVAWRNFASGNRWGTPLGYARPVASTTIALNASRNVQQDVPLALDKLLPATARADGVYHVSLSIESSGVSPPRALDSEEDYSGSARAVTSAMVTLSDIGLSARRGRDRVDVWALSLASAKPVGHVRVRLFSNKGQLLSQSLTDSNGLATLKDIHAAPGESPAVAIADRSDAALATTSEDDAALASGSGFSKQSGLTWLDLRSSELTVAEADTTGRAYLRSGYEAFIYTDRGVYRPGETVHFRTIVRGADQAVPQSFPLKWQFRRPDLRDWKSEVTSLDADGSAGLDLALPADLPTGRWTVSVGLPGDAKSAGPTYGSITFNVEEFIPERIKVVAAFSAAGKHPTRLSLSEKKLEASVQGDYLFGKPASGLLATVATRIEPAMFESPTWRGWTFNDSADIAEPLGRRKPLGLRNELPPIPLDANGRAIWPLDTAKLLSQGEQLTTGARRRKEPVDEKAAGPDVFRGPWRLSIAGAVTEQGGRAVTTSQTIEVDALPYYLAAKMESPTSIAGSPTGFAIACVTPSGELSTENTELAATLYRESWNTALLHTGGQYRYQSTRKLEAVGPPLTVVTQSGKGRVEMIAPVGGLFVLVVTDKKTLAETSLAFYATQTAWQDNISRENPEKVDLVMLPPIDTKPLSAMFEAVRAGDVKRFIAAGSSFARTASLTDADAHSPRYRVGDTARVLIRSPFAGQLLLSVETDGVVSRRRIEMSASQMVVPVEVTDACRPNAYVSAVVIRPVDPNAAWRPHRAAGVVRLQLDPGDRKLNVAIQVPKEIRPQTTLSGQVRVTDAQGSPVAGAAVTVAAVDEGILQLTSFKSPDPLGYFLATRALGVRAADIYSLLMPEVAKAQADPSTGGDHDGAAAGRHTNPIAARRVNSVALFTGVLHTDDAGIARIELPVGAFAGRLRLMAVAYTVAGAPAFGHEESPTLVRSPLLVQSSWPRFAAPGDRFSVPLTLFNSGKNDGTVTLRVVVDSPAGEPPIRFIASGKSSIDLPPMTLGAGRDAVANLEVQATEQIGVARIQLFAQMGSETFTETLELPVRPAAPWVTEGGFEAGDMQNAAKISPPAELVPGTRKLQVQVTPWPALSLPRGLDYLDRYPYGCAEQTTSTLFPLVYLNDLGDKLAPGQFDRTRTSVKIRSGILRLIGMQTADGGLSMWPGGRDAWPWASVYAAHFLMEAEAAGQPVPADFRDRLLSYCRTLLDRGSDNNELIETQAYACYALAMAGKPPRAAMSRLGELLTRQSNDEATVELRDSTARWHLSLAWLSAGRRDLAAGLVPSILPKPRIGRQLAGNLSSPIRDRAVLLSTLLAIDPKRPETAALAKEIADAGAAGHWRNTQETAMAVVALGHYIKSAANGPAYDGVEVWASGMRLANADGGKALTWELAPDALLPKDLQVRVAGQPAARAFVSWIQSGVPTTPPPAADEGMKIRRRLLDRAGNETKPSSFVSGDLVQVELSLSAGTALQNVVIEDLLPAGLEIENARLESGAAVARVQGQKAVKAETRNMLRTIHLDVRDDRMIVVGHLEAGGTGTFTFLARAVAPGTFTVPPVRAECMYDAGIRSVWGSGKLTVLSGNQAKIVRSEE